MGGYPALSIRPPQAKRPMESLGQMMQLKNMMLKQKSDELDLAQAQRQDQRQRKLEHDSSLVDQLLEGSGGDYRSKLQQIYDINPELGMAWEKQIDEIDKLSYERKKELFEMMGEKYEYLSSIAEGISDQRTYELAIQQAVRDGALDQETGQGYLETPYDPAMIERFRRQAMSAQQVATFENNKLDRERQESGDRSENAMEDMEAIGKLFSGAKSQGSFDQRMSYARNKGFPEGLLELVGDEYTPESMEMAQLWATTDDKNLGGTKEFGGYIWMWNPSSRTYDIRLGKSKKTGRAQDESMEEALSIIDDLELTGDEALAKMVPSLRGLVEGLLNYELDIGRITSIRSGRREKLVALARSVDPTFDMTQYSARAAVRRSFTSGKDKQTITSLNTVIGHLDELRQKGAALDTGSWQAINWAQNLLSEATGDPNITNFGIALTAVVDELSAIFKATGSTDTSIKQWEKSMYASMSPAQLEGGLETAMKLIVSRMEALSGIYEVGMGKPRDFRFLNEKSRSILERTPGSETLLEMDNIGEKLVGGGEAPEGTVLMRGPDGEEWDIPEELAERFLKENPGVVRVGQ